MVGTSNLGSWNGHWNESDVPGKSMSSRSSWNEKSLWRSIFRRCGLLCIMMAPFEPLHVIFTFEDLEMNSTNLCNIFKNHLLNRVFHNSYSLAMCQGRSGREQILEAWKWSVWEPDPPGESHALQEQLSSMQRLLDAKDRAWSSRPSTWQTTCRGLLAYIHTYMHIIYMPISNPNISLIHIVQSYQQYIFWFWGGSCCELFGTNVPLLVGLFQTTGPEDWISGDGRCGEGEMQIFMEICVC